MPREQPKKRQKDKKKKKKKNQTLQLSILPIIWVMEGLRKVLFLRIGSEFCMMPAMTLKVTSYVVQY